jgi:hypothetical protein
MRQIIWRWTRNWTIAWLIVGVLLMLSRAAPFAESGDSFSGPLMSYVFWVPLGGLVGVLGGLATLNRAPKPNRRSLRYDPPFI